MERTSSPSRRTAGQDVYTRGRETYKTNFQQNLYDGGATASRNAAASIQRDIAGLSLEATRQTAIQEGVLAYLNVLRQTRLVELAKGAELNIKRQLNLEDERVKRGSGIAVDVLQAKSRLQLAKEKRVNFEGALIDAGSRYAQVFGHLPDINTMTLPTPPIGALPEKMEEAVEIATNENPSVLSTGKQIDADREKRDGARAGFLPSVNLVVENNYTSDVDTVVGPKYNTQVLVKASWELFSGLSTRSGVAQAALEYGASQDKSLQARRKVSEATQLAWQALVTARKRMGLLENAMNIAAEVFEARKKLREAGKENVINVLDAENEVSNTRINFTGAAFDARQASYQLLNAMGRLVLDKALVAPGGDEIALPIPVKDIPNEGELPIPTIPLPGDIEPPSHIPTQVPGTVPPEGTNPFDMPFSPDTPLDRPLDGLATPTEEPSPFDLPAPPKSPGGDSLKPQPPAPKASPRIPVTPAPMQTEPEVMPSNEEPFDTLPVLEDKPRKAKPAPVKPVPAKPEPVKLKPEPVKPAKPAPVKPPSGHFFAPSDNPFSKPFIPQ